MVLNKIQLLWVSIWNRWPQSATRSVGFLAFELSEINGQHRLLRRRPTHTAGHETRTIVRGMENGERRTELELGAGGALIRRRLFAVRFMTRHAKRAKKEKNKPRKKQEKRRRHDTKLQNHMAPAQDRNDHQHPSTTTSTTILIMIMII